MGRNGKQEAVFPKMVSFINKNIGNVLSSKELLLGNNPGRDSATSYLYKFIKLGYVAYYDKDSDVKKGDSLFKVVKGFPKGYNSVDMKKEMRLKNGYIV